MIAQRSAFCCERIGLCHSDERAVSAPVFRRPIRPTGSLPRATDKGVVMSAWYPGWQVAAAWLLTVAVAAAIYFVPMKGLVDIMSPAEITADAE